MTRSNMVDRLIHGATAGFVGTLALQALRTASAKAIPATMPPIQQNPGKYMVQQMESRLPSPVAARVPALAEMAAAKSIAVGYGLTAGVAYAVIRRNGGDLLFDGVVLGLGTWAAGYLGWLPALGLMPPLTEQDAAEALGPAARHIAFGIATVAAYRWLSE